MKLNNNIENVIDMPKLQSPFIRKVVNKNYVCIPKINEELRWVFTDSTAVEKLDGTNVSIVVKDKKIISVYNRKNCIDFWKKGNKRFIEGILEAIDKEYINLGDMGNGQYFGELIGQQVNGNQYNLDRHLWIPFHILIEKCRFKFWDDFIKEIHGLPDVEIYKKTDQLFRGLRSLYKRQKGISGNVDENTGFEGMASEGIVFYRKNTNEMAKLRRDMFNWFKGNRHKVVKIKR